MALKWIGALGAAVALSMLGTINVVAAVSPGVNVPIGVDLVLIAAAAVGAVVVMVAEVHQRLDSRLAAMSDFMVTRLDDVAARLDELQPQPGLELLPPADVVPFAPVNPGRRLR